LDAFQPVCVIPYRNTLSAHRESLTSKVTGIPKRDSGKLIACFWLECGSCCFGRNQRDFNLFFVGPYRDKFRISCKSLKVIVFHRLSPVFMISYKSHRNS
jgi:hypothetical protein